MSIINYITAHYADLIATAGAVIIAARLIVKLTPTPADDSALEKVVNVLKHVGLNIDNSK